MNMTGLGLVMVIPGFGNLFEFVEVPLRSKFGDVRRFHGGGRRCHDSGHPQNRS